MAPSEAPTAMIPNRRRPCSLRNRSAMKPQKIVTTNSANTLVHT
jgi:hypothetical protein